MVQFAKCPSNLSADLGAQLTVIGKHQMVLTSTLMLVQLHPENPSRSGQRKLGSAIGQPLTETGPLETVRSLDKIMCREIPFEKGQLQNTIQPTGYVQPWLPQGLGP